MKPLPGWPHAADRCGLTTTSLLVYSLVYNKGKSAESQGPEMANKGGLVVVVVEEVVVGGSGDVSGEDVRYGCVGGSGGVVVGGGTSPAEAFKF